MPTSLSTRRGVSRPSSTSQLLPRLLLVLLSVLLLLSFITYAAAAPSASPPLTETELIAVDMGHENMKISGWRVQEEDVYIKPGGAGTVTTTTTSLSGSVAVVLNDQTNRKSPPCVAFRYFKDPTAAAAGDSEKKEEGESGVLFPPGYQLERTFAEQAEALAPRFPTQVVCSPAQLLGYTLANASATAAPSPYALTQDQLTASYSFHVRSLRQRQHQPQRSSSRAGEERDALGVFVPFFAASTTTSAADGAFFSAEEMTAMLLGYARRMAEKADAVDNALSEEEEGQLRALLNSSSGESLQRLRGHAVPRYAALAVPVHATVAQRQALLDAAALAGLRVVRLVHSTTGAAVQLAYTKAEQVFVPEKQQYVMVYDMGSQQAEVAIYRFAPMPPTVAKRVKYEGSIELQALVGSRSLGGAAFDECIAAQWDALYFKQSVLAGVGRATTEAERRTAAKRRGSLLRAAHKAKETLSVNQDAHITLDGLHVDVADFSDVAQRHLQQRSASLTADGLLSLRYARSDFEQACRPLFDAAVALRDEAIAATHGTVADVAALNRFEVIGGGTRVPRLLQRLSEGYRADGSLVDRTLNGDEAAVLGTTLLSVATAPRSLQLRGTQTVPRYRVREWLTNNVYVSATTRQRAADGVEEGQGEKDRASLQMLFPAHQTMVPTTRSIRVPLNINAAATTTTNTTTTTTGAAVPDSITVTLYSGAEADNAYRNRAENTSGVGSTNAADAALMAEAPASAAAAATACASCYSRTYVVSGITGAEQALRAQLGRRHRSATVALEKAEVVVEAVATVSGIPHGSVAYLRATYRITPAVNTAAAVGGGADGAPVDAAATRKEAEVDAAGGTAGTDAPTAGLADDAEETEGEETDNDAPPRQEAQEVRVASTTPSSPTAELVEVRLVALPLHTSPPSVPSTPAETSTHADTAPVLRRYNMDRAELLQSHHRVRRLLAIDDVRLHRSTVRNDIEGVLVWVKEQAEWDTEAEVNNNNINGGGAATIAGLDATWRDTVKEVGEWLDDYGETADVAALETRLAAVRRVRQALREKHNAKK